MITLAFIAVMNGVVSIFAASEGNKKLATQLWCVAMVLGLVVAGLEIYHGGWL